MFEMAEFSFLIVFSLCSNDLEHVPSFMQGACETFLVGINSKVCNRVWT